VIHSTKYVAELEKLLLHVQDVKQAKEMIVQIGEPIMHEVYLH
jgi:hypothetical protein